MRFILTCLLGLFTGVVQSSTLESTPKSIGSQLNQLYAEVVTSFSQLDIERLSSVYDENVIYLPDHKSSKIIQGKHNVTLDYQRYFNRLKQKQVQVEVGFRLTHRDITPERVTDVGYYLIRYHPAKQTEQPISEFASKFMIISKPDQNGDWHWLMEMNDTTKSENYHQATSTPSLFFSNTEKLGKQ
ncbi:MAG: hypothetical protein ACPGUD_07910 [Parashewanella sp.]